MKPSETNKYKVIRQLIRYIDTKEVKTSLEDKTSGWQNIRQLAMTEKQKVLRRRLYISLTASVAILLILLTMGYNYLSGPQSDPLGIAVSQLNVQPVQQKEILLVLSEEKKVEVASEKEVTYDKEGAITIDNTEVVEEEKLKKTEFNQLIVPKGKRTHLILSDGTKVWVNANSRIVYPRQFDSRKREIYVEGEVYLDVTRNESAHFIVKTASFEVDVLGTSFNISTYSKEREPSIVLVDGKINIRSGDQKQTLSPNQGIIIVDGKLEKAIPVDVYKYICWIDNMLVLEDEPLSYVFSKLNLYYDQEFIIDPAAESLLVRGKLDLKDDLKDVLRTLSFSTPITYETNSNHIRIKKVR